MQEPVKGRSSSSSKMYINAGQEDQMVISGFKIHKVKEFVTWVFIILTVGLLQLVFYWRPDFMLKCTCDVASLAEADFVLLKDHYNQIFVEKVKLSVASTESSKDDMSTNSSDGRRNKKKVSEVVLSVKVTDIEENQFSADGKNNGELSRPLLKDVECSRYFMNKKIKYVWSNPAQQFEKLRGLDEGLSCSYFHETQGLSQVQQTLRQDIYGTNSIVVHVTPIIKLLFTQALDPFYIFQLFSITLWYIDEYGYYASCIVIISAISLTAQIYETRSMQRALKHTLTPTEIVTVCRGDTGEYENIPSDLLVPGDIIEVPRQGCIMQCDAVLVNGNCIVNESMLTGESVPVTKTPIPNNKLSSGPDTLFIMTEHSRHVLFCGTHVIQTRYYGNQRVRAVVIRTDVTSRHPSHAARKRHDIRAAQEYESLCNVHRYLETLKTKLDRQRLLASERMGLANYDLETIIHRLKSSICRLEKSCEDYKKLIFAESKLHDCIVEYDGDWNDMRQVFVDSLMMMQEATKGLQSYVVEVTRVLDQFHPLRDFISCVDSTNIEVDMVVGSYLKVFTSHRQHTEDEYPGKDEESCLSNEFKIRVGLKGPNRSVLDDALAAVQDADAVINRSKLLIRQTEACRKFFVEADKLSVSLFTEIESLYESMLNSGTVKILKQIKCDSDLMYRTTDDIVSGFGTRSGLAHDNECSVVECKCASFEMEIPKLWEHHFYCLNILKKETDILEAMLREINTKAQTCELIKLEYVKKVEEAKLHYRESVRGLYDVTVGQLDNGFVTSDKCNVTRNLFLNTRTGILKQSKLYKLLSTERGDNNSVRLYMDMFTRCDAFVEKVEQLGQFDMLFSEAPTEYRDVSDNVKKFKTIVQSYEANVRRFYGAVADQHNLGFNASPEKTAFKETISLDNADINRTNRRTFKTVTFKCSPVVVVQKINKPLAFDKNKDYISAHGASVVKLPERLGKLSNNLISDSLNKYCVCQLRFIRAKLPSLRIESQKAILRAIDRRINFCEHILVARQDAIFNRDLFNCSICLDDVKPGDGLVLSECLHTFCKVCLNHYVRASASETASVTCPFVYSDLLRCSGFINHREMKSFFNDAEYESFLELSLRITEWGLKNTFHCGIPSCDFWAIVESVQPRQLCFLDCPKCGQSTCLRCNQIHSKYIVFDCEKRQRNKINDQNWKLTEEAVKKKLSDRVAMICPGCGVVIEKNGGCDNMTCSKCKQTFKWTGRAS